MEFSLWSRKFALCLNEITLKTSRKDARIFSRVFFESSRDLEQRTKSAHFALITFAQCCKHAYYAKPTAGENHQPHHRLLRVFSWLLCWDIPLILNKKMAKEPRTSAIKLPISTITFAFKSFWQKPLFISGLSVV